MNNGQNAVYGFKFIHEFVPWEARHFFANSFSLKVLWVTHLQSPPVLFCAIKTTLGDPGNFCCSFETFETTMQSGCWTAPYQRSKGESSYLRYLPLTILDHSARDYAYQTRVK